MWQTNIPFAALLTLLLSSIVSAGTIDGSFVFPGKQVVPCRAIRVTTLGSGSPDVRRHQVASGFLIELGNGDKFIFDLGSGSYLNLVATGVPQARLTKVFLSHLHSDHIADLASLYVGAIFGRTRAWEVWGPSSENEDVGTRAVIDGLRQFLAWDTFARRRIDMVDRKDQGDVVIAHEFDATKKDNVIYERNGVRIIATPVPHYETVGPVALRLEWANLSVTYSGDMRPNPNFEDLARGTDLLLLQNMGPIKGGDVTKLPFASQYLINTSHVTPEQAGPILAATRPRLAVLHHLILNDASRPDIISAVRAGYPEGEIHLNEDLDVFEITREAVTVRKMIVPDRTWGHWHAESNWKATGDNNQPTNEAKAGSKLQGFAKYGELLDADAEEAAERAACASELAALESELAAERAEREGEAVSKKLRSDKFGRAKVVSAEAWRSS